MQLPQMLAEGPILPKHSRKTNAVQTSFPTSIRVASPPLVQHPASHRPYEASKTPHRCEFCATILSVVSSLILI